MRIPLDRDSAVPIYRQIEAFLRHEMRAGALAPETRLPATRELAASLGVNRLTVTTAYADLEAEGLIYSRQGSGTYVAPQPASLPAQGDPAHADWPLWQQELLSRTWSPAMREMDRLNAAADRPGMISFAGGIGDARLFHTDEFRKTLQHVVRRDGIDAFGYGDRAGYAPLRATIAQVMTGQGIPTHPDQVLITAGSQQAVALVAQLLLRPGDTALVESPTYSGAIDIFRSQDIRLRGIPVDEHGMQVEHVEDALQASRPRLIYTIPNFHNPTGTCMSTARRRQLVRLAVRYNVPILEDDFVGDLRYDGHDLPALKALDPGGYVMYVGTVSKMLAPGLRLGFVVAAGPVYDRLLASKRVNDLSTSSLLQRALEAYVSVGRYQAHLRRTCQLYRRRRDALVDALQRHLPADARCIPPQGGLFAWLQLPAGISALELHPLAAEEGVTYSPGGFFFPAERDQSFARLNFVMREPAEIEEGVRRLGRAIERSLKQRSTAGIPVRQQPITV